MTLMGGTLGLSLGVQHCALYFGSIRAALRMTITAGVNGVTAVCKGTVLLTIAGWHTPLSSNGGFGQTTKLVTSACIA
jgi:hypothetical protein